MIAKSSMIGNCFIGQEMSDSDMLFWFDFSRDKFLHNIDTFYYSVKFEDDFRKESKSYVVSRFRSWLLEKSKESDSRAFDNSLSVFFEGWKSALNFSPFSYAGYFKFCLFSPDLFDIFIAPSVPPASDGGESVICEMVVQHTAENLFYRFESWTLNNLDYET